MTQEEFDKTNWRWSMQCEYKGVIYFIISLDFEEKLIGIKQHQNEGLDWKRCENIKLL
jgi:hypothetical protein